MFANATGCNTFLCEQYNFIFQHSIDKFICKGIQLYKFQNVRILRCIVQLVGSFQQILQLIRIADQKDLLPRASRAKSRIPALYKDTAPALHSRRHVDSG